MTDVYFWTSDGLAGYCSNFYRASILIDDKVYPTTEHYFQSMKTFNMDDQKMIRCLATPKEAKFAGYHVTLREDWEDVKEAVMLKALRAKFTQHSDLRCKLLATKDDTLHEDSPWDKYWGYAKGKGLDKLGVLLMQVRAELRNCDCT